MFLRRVARALGANQRRERRLLARTAEAAAARSRPGQRIALPVGDRDDRVIERRMHMRNRIEHVLANLLPGRLAALCAAAGGGAAAWICVLLLISHVELP